MKNRNKCIVIILAAFCLTGFESGAQSEKSSGPREKQNGPVLHYEETIYPQKLNQGKYAQYHLLIVSSLEEAQKTLAEDRHWAYRMAHNAYKYAGLTKEIIKDEHKEIFVSYSDALSGLLSRIKKKNPSSFYIDELKKDLKKMAGEFKYSFNYEKIKEWIKE